MWSALREKWKEKLKTEIVIFESMCNAYFFLCGQLKMKLNG